MFASREFCLLVVERALAPLRERLDRLEAERRASNLAWHGVWQPGTAYPEGALATHKGGLWVATHETRERPGAGKTSWVLVCKSGRVPRED
jgi:hypothetical protein